MLKRGRYSLAALLLLLGLVIMPPPAARAGRLPGLDLPGVAGMRIERSRLNGVVHKTLVVEFSRPCAALSSLEGFRKGLWRVGNHYVPHQAWASLGMDSVPELLAKFWGSLGLDPAQGAMLITGADMDNLAVVKKTRDGMTVWALVTAGVRGNAMRMGRDSGRYREPGTINILLLSNRRLTPRAMTRAVITATEAKTTALQDLDVRSSYHPVRWQASGTGTDNVLVVEGWGAPARLTGGHSLLGELMGRAVHAGVIEAIGKQNHLLPGRPVSERLGERRPAALAAWSQARRAGLTAVLARPRLAGFLASALALEDAWRAGLLTDLSSWRKSCAALSPRAELPAGAGPLDLALAALAPLAREAADAH